MSEIEQIKTILMESEFWQSINCRSHSIDSQGGMSVAITGDRREYRWTVRLPNGETVTSDRVWPTVQDMKGYLRHFLTQRLAELSDAAASVNQD